MGLQRSLHCPLNKGYCRHRKTKSNKHFRCATLKSPPGIQEQRASAVRTSAGEQHKMQRHIYSQPWFKSCNFLSAIQAKCMLLRTKGCFSRVRGDIFTRWSSARFKCQHSASLHRQNKLLSVCGIQRQQVMLATAGGDLVDSPKGQLSNWPPPFCPFHDHTIVTLHPHSPGGSLSRIALNPTEA